ASPVYDLLNQRGLDINEMPSIGRALDHGALAWRQHAGGHTSWPNWPAFLSWADRYITAPAAGRWLPTWTTALQVVEPQNLPPAPGFTNATVRQKLMTSIGGERLRVRFSNTFGDAPLTIERAAVARSASTDTIDARTAQSLTFGGAASVTIPPGAQWVSDAVDFATDPLSPLAVTIYTLTAPARITGHPGSRTTSYFSHADTPVDAVALPQPIPVERWYFLSGIEVLSRQPDAAVLVVVGDSITDGRGSTTDGNNRWPDVLSRRLRAHSATANVAVLNQGIGGNCVLRGGLGPTLLARLDRDVFSQPGVRWLILYEGINDLGGVASAAAKGERVTTGEDLIAAFDQIVTRARAHGIKILGATIMPFEGAFYYSAAGEAARQKLNRWIRESGRFDAVIDFDALMRDPAAPTRLQAAYDSGDHLHLNTVGLARLGEAIDVRLFE
ncbi:MAG TPA: SGNH/GDSL hydrolase family protein, partial [Candidatus Synoicihabitans sp.]|nr:SGNH/GDSL hydrolase family protein [Candidatus Synoicihabitans sp.]